METVQTEDKGRMLENLIYGHLRRKKFELFYFNEHGRECDFVVMQNGQVVQLIQVCFELNPENIVRERQGLKEAMDFFKTNKGTIITYNQTDSYIQDGIKIDFLNPPYRKVYWRKCLVRGEIETWAASYKQNTP